MDGRGLIDRVVVAALLPGGIDAEGFAEARDLAARRDAARFGYPHADVVDEALGDEGRPFVRIHEEFAHGLRRRALLPDEAVPLHLFGRKDVLEEEEPVGFEALGQGHRRLWPEMLVHVVGQLRTESEFRAQVLEHVRNGFDVGLVVEDLAGGPGVGGAG